MLFLNIENNRCLFIKPNSINFIKDTPFNNNNSKLFLLMLNFTQLCKLIVLPKELFLSFADSIQKQYKKKLHFSDKS